MTSQEIMAQIRDKRRAAGLNVAFTKLDGTRDEWSFRDVAERDEFTARLTSEGRQWEIAS